MYDVRGTCSSVVIEARHFLDVFDAFVRAMEATSLCVGMQLAESSSRTVITHWARDGNDVGTHTDEMPTAPAQSVTPLSPEGTAAWSSGLSDTSPILVPAADLHDTDDYHDRHDPDVPGAPHYIGPLTPQQDLRRQNVRPRLAPLPPKRHFL